MPEDKKPSPQLGIAAMKAAGLVKTNRKTNGKALTAGKGFPLFFVFFSGNPYYSKKNLKIGIYTNSIR